MDWSGIIIAVIGLLAGGTGAWFIFRGKKVDAEVASETTEATATAAFLQGQQAFQEYTSKLVADAVEAAVKPMQLQLDAMAARLEEVHGEAQEMKRAARQLATDLWLWDRAGRNGNVPTFTTSVLHALELGHLIRDRDMDTTVEIEPLTKE